MCCHGSSAVLLVETEHVEGLSMGVKWLEVISDVGLVGAPRVV